MRIELAIPMNPIVRAKNFPLVMRSAIRNGASKATKSGLVLTRIAPKMLLEYVMPMTMIAVGAVARKDIVSRGIHSVFGGRTKLRRMSMIGVIASVAMKKRRNARRNGSMVP